MSFEDDISAVISQMGGMLSRFRKGSMNTLFLSTEDQALFKRLALEAKSMTDAALGVGNDYSLNLISTINTGSGGFVGGPSYAAVSESIEILRGAINQFCRKQSQPSAKSVKPQYVDLSRIMALRSLRATQWDFTRLAQMCVELNAAHDANSYVSIAMLVRAIVDHVPPIFGQTTFTTVANNYAGTASFKKSIQNLDRSLRNIADAQLHTQIRKQEILPVSTQVNFGNDLDVLLAEVIRISSQP